MKRNKKEIVTLIDQLQPGTYQVYLDWDYVDFVFQGRVVEMPLSSYRFDVDGVVLVEWKKV